MNRLERGTSIETQGTVALALCGLLLAGCSPDKARYEAAPVDAGAPVKKEPPKNPWAGIAPVGIGQHAGAATHVTFSPDGRLLLSTGKDKLVKIWDLGTGQLVRNLEGHTGDVAMADFSPDGRLVVSASADQSARVWEVATGKCKLVLKDPPLPKPKDEEEAAAQAAIPPPTMNWATFNADSTQVITASQDFALKIWELGKGKKVQTIQDDGCFQRSVHRRRDAKGWLSAAGCMDDGVTYLKFWDEAGNLQNTQGNETQDAHYLAYDRAGQFLATADGSVMLSIYSAQGSFLKKIMVGTYHFCLVFGPGDKVLLVGTDGGEIFGYRPPAWERVGKLDVGEKVAVDSLALSPSDGSLVAALRNGKIIRFATPVE